ncbi:hypothetical protein Tco_1306510, partial [Tanacetum coccineum]
MKEANSRAKVQSSKTRNNIKPVEKVSNVNKPERWNSKGYRLSPNKSSAGHENTNTPRSCIWWNPTGRIFNNVGLRWVPTRKIFTSSTTKVDSEPSNGSNEDITNLYECEQTLNVSAGTLNLSAEQSPNSSQGVKEQQQRAHFDDPCHELLKVLKNSSQGVKEQQQRAHFDDPCHELLHKVYISQGSSSNSWKVNGENQVVSKSSAVTAANASNKRQQQLDLTSSTSTLASSVTANGNFDLLYGATRTCQQDIVDIYGLLKMVAFSYCYGYGHGCLL